MKGRFGFSLLLLALTVSFLHGQSYRGLAVVGDRTAYVCGSKGTVLKTWNGGQRWDTISPPGYANKEFRDIHVADSVILVMSSGDSAVVLRSEDYGKTWKEVFRQDDTLIFLDAMHMVGPMGAIIGDPFPDEKGDLRFEFLTTTDQGKTWQRDSDLRSRPITLAQEGEALFAASGSNLYYNEYVSSSGDKRSKTFRFITGGMANTFRMGDISVTIPCQACPSCGMYSMAAYSTKGDSLNKPVTRFIFVGGNYLKPNDSSETAYYFELGPNPFPEVSRAITMPSGYRSGVAASRDSKILLCTGTNGCDVSYDGGLNWKAMDLPGMNVVQFSPNFIWMAGNKGQVMRIPIDVLPPN